MSENLEELTIKIGVKVEDEELKKVQKKINDVQKEGQTVKAKILGTEQKSSGSASSATSSQDTQQFNQDTSQIIDILTKSQKNLFDLLEVVKKGNLPSGDSERKKKESNLGGFLSPVHSVVDANAGTLVGGAAGALAGSFAGNPLAGVAIGSSIGGLLQKVFEKVSDKLSDVASAFEAKLDEDSHLRQLSYQTGKTRDELYKLQQQATLAGTSLEKIVESGQSLSDELIGGMDEKKAQVYMALGINPLDILRESRGNTQKAQQMIYERATKAVGNENPSYRTSFLKILGFSPEDQDARRRLYRPDFRHRAEQVYNTATDNGKVPFATDEQINQQILKFLGGKLDIGAAVRVALSAGNVAQNLSVGLMKVQSESVTIITNAINGLNGTTKETFSQNVTRESNAPAFGTRENRPNTAFWEGLSGLFYEKESDSFQDDNGLAKAVQ